ncbi:hypothetical protein A9G28_03130 [Gilliamella sp. Fer1-1]|uniref:hypothetical protein n=1 Tax=Gilliamella sp. Fer1-1 TaxID=3120240 RepID=UPI00080EDA64|nr:hypothetical protein [Gilliamella apicola]OCG44094.1 hypothetical protein A9G28_03130 [Gilliamella apicola]
MVNQRWINELSNLILTSNHELTNEPPKIIALKTENKALKIANEMLKKRTCTSSTTQAGEVPIYEATVVIVSGTAGLSSVESKCIWYAQELYLCSSGLNKEVKEIDDKKG